MEPLYQTSAVLTLEEYRSYVYALRGRRTILLTVIAEVLFLLEVLLFSNWASKLFAAVVFLLFPLAIWLILNWNTKRIFTSNQLQNGAQTQLFFYEDHLEQITPSGTLRVAYHQLYRVVETKTHFYLMVGRGQGIIVVKANCLSGLIDFLGQLKITVEGRNR